MAVVPPEERAAASSVTNVPRSLASAMAPLPAGALLDYSLFGWPLILGSACKLVYDALLLPQFRSVTLILYARILRNDPFYGVLGSKVPESTYILRQRR
jgi:hypothetical protein